MPARVVVLGGGVGGTLVANLLDKSLGREAHISVIDPTGMHHYQPGYLYVALGQANGRWLVRDERSLLRRDVDLIVDRAIRIHPDAGHRPARTRRERRMATTSSSRPVPG